MHKYITRPPPSANAGRRDVLFASGKLPIRKLHCWRRIFYGRHFLRAAYGNMSYSSFASKAGRLWRSLVGQRCYLVHRTYAAFAILRCDGRGTPLSSLALLGRTWYFGAAQGSWMVSTRLERMHRRSVNVRPGLLSRSCAATLCGCSLHPAALPLHGTDSRQAADRCRSCLPFLAEFVALATPYGCLCERDAVPAPS